MERVVSYLSNGKIKRFLKNTFPKFSGAWVDQENMVITNGHFLLLDKSIRSDDPVFIDLSLSKKNDHQYVGYKSVLKPKDQFPFSSSINTKNLKKAIDLFKVNNPGYPCIKLEKIDNKLMVSGAIVGDIKISFNPIELGFIEKNESKELQPICLYIGYVELLLSIAKNQIIKLHIDNPKTVVLFEIKENLLFYLMPVDIRI